MKKINKLLFCNISLYFLIKVAGTFFALFIFDSFSPLVDAKHFLNEGDAFYYLQHGNIYESYPLRNYLIQIMATFLKANSNPLITNIIFSLFSGIGILILSFIMRSKLILLFLLLPSAFIWTSIVGKEAITYGCGAFLLAIWAIYIKDYNKKISVITLLSAFSLILIIITLRPHYSIPLIYLFSSSIVLVSFKSKKLKVFFIITLLLVASFVITYLFIGSENIKYNLVIWSYEAIDPFGRASRHALYNIDLAAPHLVYNKSLIIKNGIFSIIGPFPSELHRITFIPFFIEGITILLFPIFMLFLIAKNKEKTNTKYKQLYLVCILPAIILAIIIHAPFGILNPGSAIRWRVNFELLLYGYPFVLFLLSRKINPK